VPSTSQYTARDEILGDASFTNNFSPSSSTIH
jgi:hypothetical protein